MSFEIANKTRVDCGLDWEKIKDIVLGKKYELSVALVGDKEMARVRRLSGHKKKANVLSFIYGKTSGEIVLNIPRIKLEVKKYSISFRERLLFLYVHSLLHLKGYDHKRSGEAILMGKKELFWLKKF